MLGMRTLGWLSAGVLGLAMVLPAFAADNDKKADQRQDRRERREQRPGGQGPQRGMMLQRLQDAVNELQLTDDQKTKLSAIFDETRKSLHQKQEELKDAPPEERREAMEQASKELREKVNGVLNDEQKVALREKMEAARRRMGDGPASRPAAGAMLDRLRETAEKLDLSADQKQQIAAIFQDARAQAQELRAKGEPGPEQREQWMQLMRDTREKVMNVLNDEQKEKLRELTPSPGGGGRDGQGLGGGQRPRRGQR